MLRLVQRSQHLIFALLWWWWGLDTEDILEFYGLNSKTGQWQATIILWLTPACQIMSDFREFFQYLKFRVYCQHSSVWQRKSEPGVSPAGAPSTVGTSEENPWVEGESRAGCSWGGAGASNTDTKWASVQTVTEQNSLAPQHWSQSFLAFWVHSFSSVCSE